jgi:hypothetical protein
MAELRLLERTQRKIKMYRLSLAYAAAAIVAAVLFAAIAPTQAQMIHGKLP